MPRPSGCRRALAAIPDGTWVGEDLIDCDAAGDDEEYRVRVTVTKRGGRAEVDFSGTSRQARTCINATPLDAKTTVGIAFKYLFDPEGWFTFGRDARGRPRHPGGDGRQRAPAGRRCVRVLGAEPGDALGASARARTGSRRGGDRGRPRQRRHPQRERRPAGRVAVDLGRAGRRRDRRLRSATGTATPTAQMLSYQANGIGVAVESVESEVPGRRAPPRTGAGHRRRRATTGAVRRCCGTRSGSRPPSTT